MDYIVHGILQARILDWVVYPFSSGSSQHKLNRGLLHCRGILYQLSYEGSLEKPRQHIKKQRHCLPTEFHLIKSMVFQVVMYGSETWTIKLNTEELKLSNCGTGEDSRVPWTARSNQSILKEVIPGCSLEGLMLKLKLQYFGHLMRRTDSLEKTLMLGKIEGRRRRG